MDSDREGAVTRRSLAVGLAAASGAVLLALPAAADEPPVEAALAVSPTLLDAEQRADLRNGVRSLAKALADARRKEVPNDVDPAFVYLPGGGAR